MTVTAFTEAVHPMAPLLEAVHQLSIDEVIVGQNQTIVVGQVLGATGVTADDTVTNAAGAGNVGNGTMGTVTPTAAAINGQYNLAFLTAGATAEFELTDPNGQLVGTGKVGTAFAGALGFAITTGGTSFAVGDTWSFIVTRPFDEGGEQFEAWNPAATDGSQNADSIALYPCTTGAGQTAKIAALRRDGAARASDLTWNGSATTAQIAYATQQLAKKNIVLR